MSLSEVRVGIPIIEDVVHLQCFNDRSSAPSDFKEFDPKSIIKTLNERNAIYLQSEEEILKLRHWLKPPQEERAWTFHRFTKACLSVLYGEEYLLDRSKICLYDAKNLQELFNAGYSDAPEEIITNPLKTKQDFHRLCFYLSTSFFEVTIKFFDYRARIYLRLIGDVNVPEFVIEKPMPFTRNELFRIANPFEYHSPKIIFDLQNARFKDTKLFHSELVNIKLNEVQWSYAFFWNVNFLGADLSGSKLINVTLCNCNFKHCVFDQETEIRLDEFFKDDYLLHVFRTIITIDKGTILESLMSQFLRILNLRYVNTTGSDLLHRVFDHLHNEESILTLLDSLEEGPKKNTILNRIIEFLDSIKNYYLEPLFPALLDILIHKSNPVVTEFVFNRMILKKIEASNTKITDFSYEEMILINNHFNNKEDLVRFFLNYPNFINEMIVFDKTLDEEDPYKGQNGELERIYHSLPEVAPYMQMAKEADLWVDLPSLDRKMEGYFANLCKSADKLHALGVIDSFELISLDLNTAKIYAKRFAAVKGSPPIQTAGNDPRQVVGKGSGLLGSRGLLSRFKQVKRNPGLMDHLFDTLYKTDPERAAARNLLNIHFRPMIRRASLQEVRDRLIALNTDISLWIQLLEDTQAKKRNLSKAESLLYLGNSLSEALVVNREFVLNIANYAEVDWTSAEFFSSNGLAEFNKGDPALLTQKFSPFPIFRDAYLAELNKGKLLKLLTKLNLGERYKEFSEAAKKFQHRVDMTNIKDQEELNQVFRKFLKPLGKYQGALDPEVRLKEEHLHAIYTTYGIENAKSETKAYYLFVLSLIFARYSSTFFFGRSGNSPQALREYSLALLNGARDLCSEFVRVDFQKRLRDRLVGVGGALECTAVIAGMMAEVCKSKQFPKTGVEKSLCDVFKENCPLGWQ